MCLCSVMHSLLWSRRCWASCFPLSPVFNWILVFIPIFFWPIFYIVKICQVVNIHNKFILTKPCYEQLWLLMEKKFGSLTSIFSESYTLGFCIYNVWLAGLSDTCLEIRKGTFGWLKRIQSIALKSHRSKVKSQLGWFSVKLAWQGASPCQLSTSFSYVKREQTQFYSSR